MKLLILVRHAHAASNVTSAVNSVPPGDGLTATGIEQSEELARLLAAETIDRGVSSRLLRATATLEIALAGRHVPRSEEPLLDEIGFGAFEGGSLDAYHVWAWGHGPAVAGPGGAESRAGAAARITAGLDSLLARREETILAVTHGLPVRYVVDAAGGRSPRRRLTPVSHATPFRLEHDEVERAAALLRAWSLDPAFDDAERNTPFGG